MPLTSTVVLTREKRLCILVDFEHDLTIYALVESGSHPFPHLIMEIEITNSKKSVKPNLFSAMKT